jgi:hypothetical protein
MTDREFFAQTQLEWYQEFVDQEVREIVQDTNTQAEFFEFDDVPF